MAAEVIGDLADFCRVINITTKSSITTDLSLKRILKSRIPLIFTPLTGKNESPPTDFTHLRAGPKIMSAMWGLNRVAESFLRLKWGKEFIITN